ncbi:MAG TPA: TIGR02530 family flagellar biosynthesis protein [Chthonomonadales bacterium]|nr:TIGR02530 family flagellar biosynthesis protein [Chthonomonadales bacterium]
MADTPRIDPRLLTPLQPIPGAGSPPRTRPADGQAFADLLRSAETERAADLRFSAHAQTRIQSRQIAIGHGEMARIEGAVEKAAAKGARESLILVDDTALVVSIRNRTVITVVDRENLKQNVFTNIDSAVIA